MSQEKPSDSNVKFLKHSSGANYIKKEKEGHQTKPNLADLAKISLGTSSNTRCLGSNIVRPSLSELAKANLQPANLKGNPFHVQRLPNQPPTSSLGNCSSQTNNLNLALALRNKTLINENRGQVVIKNVKMGHPVLIEAIRADPSLISNQASPLGRVIGSNSLAIETLFPKFKQPSLDSKCSPTVALFDFKTPSPDDLIRSRLRIN